MVATACLFGLVVLRAERLATVNLNDSAVHTQMVRYIGRKVEGGDWPLSGWYPFWGLGYPFLEHYQAVPAMLTALVGRVIGYDVAHAWALYLLLALWPLAVYAAARLFELDRLVAASAALVSPLLMSVSSYGYEHQSYVWQGFGIWTQLFAMWLLPLSWALTWRAVCRDGSLLWGALALTATVTLHFLTGYQALCAVGIWVLIGGRTGVLRRIRRALVLYVVALAGSAWVLVPLVSDSAWTGHSVTEIGNPDFDSYGAPTILGWLFTGDLYDAGRLPVITVLVAVGIVAAALQWRSLPAAPALLAIVTFSFLLWFGRPFWGGLTALLPGGDALLLHRFIMGTHLAGILFAGLGLAWLFRLGYRLAAGPFFQGTRAVRRGASVVPLVLASAVFALLVPAAQGIRDFDQRGALQIAFQRSQDAVSGEQVRTLARDAVSRGAGRVYGGSRNNWGQTYTVGQVPVYAVLNALDVEAPGFTLRAASLSVDVEGYLNPDDPSQLRLLGIRWLIYPESRAAPAGAALVRALGVHRLYELPGITGLVAVGDISGVVAADNRTVGRATLGFLQSGRADRGSYDAVAFQSDPVLALTAPQGGAAPGTVLRSFENGDDGRYRADVSLTRPGVVVLKVSYHGRWKAFVDGAAVPIGMVAPSFVGVPVPAGNHTVQFRFVSADRHVPLLLLAVLAFTALFLGERLLRRRRT